MEAALGHARRPVKPFSVGVGRREKERARQDPPSPPSRGDAAGPVAGGLLVGWGLGARRSVLLPAALRARTTNPLTGGRTASGSAVVKRRAGDSAPTCQLPPSPLSLFFRSPGRDARLRRRLGTPAAWSRILTSGSHVPPRHLSAGSGPGSGDGSSSCPSRPFVLSCIALQACLFPARSCSGLSSLDESFSYRWKGSSPSVGGNSGSKNRTNFL